MSGLHSKRKCPACGSRDFTVSFEALRYAVWAVFKGVAVRDLNNEGEPTGRVFGQCTICGHKWQFRVAETDPAEFFDQPIRACGQGAEIPAGDAGARRAGQ